MNLDSRILPLKKNFVVVEMTGLKRKSVQYAASSINIHNIHVTRNFSVKNTRMFLTALSRGLFSENSTSLCLPTVSI